MRDQVTGSTLENHSAVWTSLRLPVWASFHGRSTVMFDRFRILPPSLRERMAAGGAAGP